MFRPGENWLYDLFMGMVRFWWHVIRITIFAVFFVVRWRERSQPTMSAPPQKPKNLVEPEFAFVSNGFLSVIGVVVMAFALVPAIDIYDRVFYRRIVTKPVDIFLMVSLNIGVVALGFYLVRSDYKARQVQLTSARASAEAPPPPVAPPTPINVYTIRLPAASEWSGEQALHLIDQLYFYFPQVGFRIYADDRAIVWQIVDMVYDAEPSVLEQLIRASYPKAEIALEIQTTQEIRQPFYRHVSFYRQPNMFVAPLLYVTDIRANQSHRHFDPLASLTHAVSNLQAGESVSLTLVGGGLATDAYDLGNKLITQSTIHPLQFFSRYGVSDAMTKVIRGADRTEKYVPQDQHVLEEKLRQKLYGAALIVQVDAATPVRVAEILVLVDTQIANFTRLPYNALQWVERPLEQYMIKINTSEQARKTNALTIGLHWIEGSDQAQLPPRLILEPREIAALWHLPHQGFQSPRIQWASGVVEVSEVLARNQEGITLGGGQYRGRRVPVKLPQVDRVTHLNIVGKTGTGKSTLMHHLIHQDIAAGRGVAVIDPHGKLVSDILRRSIPPEREQDVIVLDLANEAYPPPLNPLVGKQDYTSTLKMVGIIDRLFAGTEESARMASYLRAALIPLQTDAQATMRDVTRLFMDPVYRQERLSAVDDPETQDFWDYHYNPSSPALQRQISEPIIIRVRPFYANPTLYPILCHPDSLDFRSIIRDNKILLVSLAMDEERVPEQERNLIGALLMSRLQMSGMKARAENHDPFFIYVDEVQKFVTTSLSDVLSEARKFGLSLVTANQFLDQLTGKTLEAVMGNVGTTVVFRCSPDDGETLARYMSPEFNAHDLVDLDRFQAVVKMQAQGETQPAFTLQTPPPISESTESGDEAAAGERERRIRQRSIDTYTPKTREVVLDWLKSRYRRGGNTTTAPAAEADPNADASTFYEA